jgi:hypothetical protein
LPRAEGMTTHSDLLGKEKREETKSWEKSLSALKFQLHPHSIGSLVEAPHPAGPDLWAALPNSCSGLGALPTDFWGRNPPYQERDRKVGLRVPQWGEDSLGGQTPLDHWSARQMLPLPTHSPSVWYNLYQPVLPGRLSLHSWQMLHWNSWVVRVLVLYLDRNQRQELK